MFLSAEPIDMVMALMDENQPAKEVNEFLVRVNPSLSAKHGRCLPGEGGRRPGTDVRPLGG
jgi:hypothetical protein